MIANVKVYLNTEFLGHTELVVDNVDTMLTDPSVAEQLTEKMIPLWDSIEFQFEVLPN